MLQRVQTIFMAFATAAMVAFLFLPIWGKSQDDPAKEQEEYEYVLMSAFQIEYTLRSDTGKEQQVLGTQSTLPLSGGAIGAALIMIFSISQFKNRLTQMKLNALFSLFAVGTLLGSYFYITKANALFDPVVQGNFLVGFFLPIVAMFNNFIANRFIRRDEKLVRSADRIR
ncbi:MAG: DUF4293 domain-containing protein [Bacteroidota bacterium]